MATPEDAGSIYSDIRIRLDALNGDIKSVKTSFDNMNKNITTGGTSTQKSMTKNFDAIKVAGVGAMVAITVAFKQAIKTFADTEQQLANVRAVSDSTAKEFEALETAANNAGVTTRFTASEAADALFYLASAGLEATESVEALDGVLLLAGATGSGLAESAQAITATLSQYGLEASKAADVSNIFAAANSNSQATLDKLANALQQVGPIAAGLGIGLEETVGSLEALFNAGYKGETAGRALKSALADLANESSETIKKLDILGVSFSDVDPTVVGLTGAIGALEEAGITTSQTIDVFGKVAGGQLATLIGTGQAALEDYTKAVTDTDEAARQYAIQNDTLAGSQDAFKSALEGTSNSLIATLTPTFRTIIDLGTGFLKLINKIPDVLKGVGAGAITAGLGVGALSKALAFLPGVLGTIGVSLAGALGPVALIGGVVIGLTAMVAKADEVKKADLAKEFAKVAQELGYTGTALDEFLDKVADVEANLERFGAVDNFESIRDAVSITSEELDLTNLEVIKIGKNSKLISDEYKDQLTKLENQLIEQNLINEANIRRNKLGREALNNNSSEFKAQREMARLALEKEKRDKIALDRELRLKEIKEEATLLDELANKGAIDEADALEQKIALRNEEIDLLVLQQLTSGETSAKSIADIKAQRAEIERYEARLQVLADNKDKEVEDEKTRTEEQEKADQDKIDSIKAVKEANEDVYDSISDKIKDSTQTKREALKEEYDEAIAAAEALGQDTAAIEQYFSDQSKALDDKEAEEKKEQNIETAGAVYDITKNLYDTLVNARIDAINGEIAEIERLTEAQLAAIDTQTNALLEAQGLQEETKLESLQRQLDAVNGTTQTELEILDAATQKKLADLGLLEDTTLQTLQKELDAAILAGDTETAAELEDELARETILQDAADAADVIEKAATAKALEDEIARTKILEDAEAEKAAIELQAAKDTAKLQYKAEIAGWESSKINTAIAGAQAAISAYGALAGIPIFGPELGIAAASAVGTATLAQLAVINKNKPVEQTFATGGIVLPEPGVSSTGDNIRIGVNPGEAVFTKEQQSRLLSLANGGGSSNSGSTMIQLFMDSKVVAQGVARNFNNGIVKVVLK